MFGTIFTHRNPHVGASPGTLVIPETSPAPRVRMIRFNHSGVEDSQLDMGQASRPDRAMDQAMDQALDENFVSWIDVQGFGDLELLKKFGQIFDLHHLLLEDIVNVPQRPKAEVYGNQLLIIVRMVHPLDSGKVILEQVSVVIGKTYVLTFQQRYGDVFDPVRNRIREATSLIRKHGADFLGYALIDTVIDGYYPVLEEIGDHLEALEMDVVWNPSRKVLGQLNQFKNQLVNMRRGIWPQREAISQLARGNEGSLSEEVRLHLRDTYDHCVQITEVTEVYREMVTGLMGVYLSAVANRTNEVMKVLTITATLFIPLTFMVGVYGMNFDHMPELHVKWGYPIFWGVMIVVGVSMTAYFYHLGWIGNNDDATDDDDT